MAIADAEYPFRLCYDFIAEVYAEVKKLVHGNHDASPANKISNDKKLGNAEIKAIPKILYNLMVRDTQAAFSHLTFIFLIEKMERPKERPYATHHEQNWSCENGNGR